MYAIMSGGALIALCEKPRYVKLNEDSGAWVEANAEEAVGVSVCGDLYNINGGNAIPDAPEAVVSEGDVSEYVFRNRAKIVENEENTGTAIVDVENAVCELDAATDTRISEAETALCELDELINGGGEK